MPNARIVPMEPGKALPCPFCGFEKIAYQYFTGSEANGYADNAYMYCRRCHASCGAAVGIAPLKPPFYADNSTVVERAITLWNTRYQEKVDD